jgi:hypothetical protein
VQSAGRAQDEFGAEVVMIKKTSSDYSLEKDPPHCPSVMVDGRIIAKNDLVTYEALKAAILNMSNL